MASTPSSSLSLCDELTLDDLMADPIVQLVMQRDGVNSADMLGELHRVRQAYGEMAMA